MGQMLTMAKANNENGSIKISDKIKRKCCKMMKVKMIEKDKMESAYLNYKMMR